MAVSVMFCHRIDVQNCFPVAVGVDTHFAIFYVLMYIFPILFSLYIQH